MIDVLIFFIKLASEKQIKFGSIQILYKQTDTSRYMDEEGGTIGSLEKIK